MKHNGKRRRSLQALLAAALSVAAGAAWAQAYPNKPIRLVVPFAPGGTTDIVARAIGDPLARELGQPVIIENRGGGGGSIGALALAKSPPDGYTLGIATVSTMATNPATNPQLPYDPIKDFVPVINLANVPNVLTVNPKVPARNLAEFIALLKSQPGQLSYATPGMGSIAHLDGELFKSLTGTSMTHIPYKGSGPALNDVLAGQVGVQFDNLPSSFPHIEGGKLRALAIAAPRRLESMKDVPTYAELGLRDMNNMAWYGIVAPSGTPADIVAKVNAAAAKALNDPAVRKRIQDNGAATDGGSPEHFASMIRRELELRRKIARDANIKVE
jgi:tripartite-type tricarboxylate transporter receptor subunit TctC